MLQIVLTIKHLLRSPVWRIAQCMLDLIQNEQPDVNESLGITN